MACNSASRPVASRCARRAPSAALFAAFDNLGQISIVTAAITYRIAKNGRPVTEFIIENRFAKPKAIFMGETEIVDELNAKKTPRVHPVADGA